LNERRILLVTSLCAAAVPLGAFRYLSTRLADDLSPALAELTGQPVQIGAIDAGLTGTVRLTGVAIGDLLRADAIEASAALGSLLAGDLRADEIRVEGPRLRARVDGGGDSDLARALRRVVARRARPPAAPTPGRPHLRRVVVTEGALTVDLVGVGRVEADAVELHPQDGGVRVVTGPVTMRAASGRIAATARFSRAAADLSLTDARVGRALAVGGVVTVVATRADGSAGSPLVIQRALVGRGLRAGSPATVLLGEIDDGGVPRPVTAAAEPGAIRLEASALPLAALAPLAPAGLDLATARASGAATLAWSAGAIRLRAAGAIAGAAVERRAVAAERVPIDLGVELDAELDGAVVIVHQARATMGALTARGHGWVRRGGPAGFQAGVVDAAVDRAGCLALLESLPAPLRGPLTGLTMTGDAAARAHLDFDLGAPLGQGVALSADLDAGDCAVVADPPAVDPRRLAGRTEHVFPDGHKRVVGPGAGDWVGLRGLPRVVPGAFVAAEDAHFFAHRGFDLPQIGRSLEVDLREGRFARGGSTITQQLVKNAFLSQRRSLDRKLQEAILTWRVEATLDKDVILERYLNIVELGPGVHGVAAAARHWFGVPVGELSAKEAAFLAALTPEPQTMSRRIAAAGRLDPVSAERVAVVLRAMRYAGVITAEELAAARSASLSFRSAALTAPRAAAAPAAAAAAGSRSPDSATTTAD